MQPVISGLLSAKVEGSSGKLKRLHLQTLDGKVEIRLPKALRVAAQEELQIGQPVRLWVERRAKGLRAVAIVPLTPKALIIPRCRATTCISVCAAKNCCRRGGHELYSKLMEASRSVPGLKIRKCGCLKRCQQGPNVRVQGGQVEAVTCREVPHLVEKLTDKAGAAAWN